MPVLYLLRHGNAGFGGPGQDDHDRALNQAGERAALLV
ncbi:MAG: histidine phosphatase family protein, partial [Rhodospirillaceae bacterium]|nr:histidine phosphatase family protein [Rhodospirillaceae bacterium]